MRLDRIATEEEQDQAEVVTYKQYIYFPSSFLLHELVHAHAQWQHTHLVLVIIKQQLPITSKKIFHLSNR